MLSTRNLTKTTIRIASEIVYIRGIPKSKTVETLLKNESDAITRYDAEIAYSKYISHVIVGINLRPSMQNPQKYHDIKPYDIAAIDFGELIQSRTGLWIITRIEIDVDTNVVTISVKEKV